MANPITLITQSLEQWLKPGARRTNYDHPQSVLPVHIKTSEEAMYRFMPPQFGLPQTINILDKQYLGGVNAVPATGPRQ